LEMFYIIFMVLVFEEMEDKNKFEDAYEKYKKDVPAISFKHHCLYQLFERKKK